MQAMQVLNRLQGMGIHLSAHCGIIRAQPKKALTDKARQLIRANKAALLQALQGTIDQGAIAAAAERAAIPEYDAGLSRCEAEIVAALAEAFYSHLFGPAKATHCCFAPAGRYCTEGKRLRDDYDNAAQTYFARQRQSKVNNGK